MIRHITLGIVALLVWASIAHADDPAAEVAPLVDNLTLAVVRVDVAGIDIDAAAKWLEPVATNLIIDPEDRQAAKEGLAKMRDAARQWAGAFTKAGGKTLWLLVSLDAYPNNTVYVVAPLEEGADERALRELFQLEKNAPRDQADTVIKLGNNLAFSPDAAALKRLREIKPVARPEVGQALTEAGDAKIRVAVVPSYDARRVIEAVTPKLPDGTPMSVLTNGIVWASAGLQPPPGASLHAVVHSQDAKAAEALVALIQRLPDQAPKDDVRVRMTWRRILADAHATGDQITLDLDEHHVGMFAGLLGGGLIQARTKAARAQSASNIRQMLIVCQMYANEHKGEFPPSLEDAAKTQDLPAAMFVNPEHPARRPGYVYIRPADGTTAPSERLVIYGAFKEWLGGTNVGFADGHCEWIGDQATFEKFLKDAQAHAAM